LVGLAGPAAGSAIGVVGDAGVRDFDSHFAEVLGMSGLRPVGGQDVNSEVNGPDMVFRLGKTQPVIQMSRIHPGPYQLMGAHRGHSPNFLGVVWRFRGAPHQSYMPDTYGNK
jgi:hypothetical protein